MGAAAGQNPADGLTIAQLRAELVSLASLAGTAELPKPTVVNDAWHPMPGPEWQVNYPCEYGKPDSYRRYAVRVVDNDDVADAAYISTPGHMPGDFTPGTTTELRQYAMAILAACELADHRTAGVPRLEDQRRKRRPKGDQMT